MCVSISLSGGQGSEHHLVSSRYSFSGCHFIFLISFRHLGAGDIKLFSVVCAFTNLKFTALCIAAAFVAAAGYGLISMVLKKELFVRMRDGFLYLNGILCGRFMRYRGQGKAVSFAVYVLLGQPWQIYGFTA